MKRSYYLFILTVLMAFSSCKKDGFGPLTDSVATIPVTITNAMASRPEPTVSVSKATGIISIQLAIPSTSGRTIKEITRVSATTTPTAVQGTTGLYNTAPIPASGTSVEFTSTLAQYTAKTGKAIAAANNVELANRFYFLITLDNNQTIVTRPVRVFVVQ
jgi:hypothetical protein